MSHSDKSLSRAAVAAMFARMGGDQLPPLGPVTQPFRPRPNPPSGNTGGILRQTYEKEGKTDEEENGNPDHLPDNTPPLGEAGGRASRAKTTTSDMRKFLSFWFFDWMSLTMQNPVTGKGKREPGVEGQEHEGHAVQTLATWAMSQGLYCTGVGNGSDGFDAGGRLAWSPIDKNSVGKIRAGHATNMPNLELPGADGACHELALSALDLLGPVLVSRADVSLDWRQEGLLDDLLDYARRMSGSGAGQKMKAPRVITSETGTTFYWGSSEVGVKVYQKDMERVHRGKLDASQADPDLIRIEFTFRPQSDRKAGFAALGPADMLATSHWVREFVIETAKILNYAGEDPEIAKQTVEIRPDTSTAQDRAEHMIRQSAKSCMAAAAVQIVETVFDGDWSRASIEPEYLHDRAVVMISEYLLEIGAAANFVLNAGVHHAQTDQERASEMVGELEFWIRKRGQERSTARNRLFEALTNIGLTPTPRERPPETDADAGAEMEAA